MYLTLEYRIAAFLRGKSHSKWKPTWHHIEINIEYPLYLRENHMYTANETPMWPHTEVKNVYFCQGGNIQQITQCCLTLKYRISALIKGKWYIQDIVKYWILKDVSKWKTSFQSSFRINVLRDATLKIFSCFGRYCGPNIFSV